MLKNRLISVIIVLVLCFTTINTHMFALGLEKDQKETSQQKEQQNFELSNSSALFTNSPKILTTSAGSINYGEYLSEEILNQFGRGAIYNEQKQVRSTLLVGPNLYMNINTLAQKRIQAEHGIESCANKTIYAIGQEFNDPSSSFGSDLLPSAVDNSILPAFPEIGNQGDSNSCTVWALGYYQLTHNTALVRGLNAKQNSSYRMSPRFMYNLTNCGVNSGSELFDAMNVACSFGCATVPQTGIVDSSTDDIDTWDFGADVWESALSNKAKSASVFEIKNEGLDKLKKLLTNGYVASFITTIDYWTYRAAQYPSGDVVCTASIINESITNALGHTMTIVGYDDNVCVDLDDNGCITDDERGALKVVNSWSSSYLNDGYCWVLYSALINETELNDENQESVNEEANSEEAITKEAVVVDGLIYFIEPSVSYTPLLLAEVTLNTAKRNELSVDIGISSTDEETPSYTATVTDYIMRDRPNNNNNFESLSKGYSLAFKNYKIREGSFANFTIVSTYELSPSDATFRFDLTPVIQDYYDDHASLFGQESEVSDQTSLNYNQNPDLRFYVSISDSDYNNYPNILKNFQIKGSGSKVESEVNYTLPLTANGPPTQTAYVDFNIKPMLVSATNEFNIAFNQSVSPESIYDGVEVKTKTSENTYGSIVDAMKILGLNGTVLKIKPPYIGLSTGRKYVEHQHYSVVFFNYLKTPGGTPITPPKVFDFYIMQ